MAAVHMNCASPYIFCPCRIGELLYTSSGYNSMIWLTDFRVSHKTSRVES